MAEEVAALVIRLEATQARFQRDMQRAEASMRRSAGGIEARATQMSNRVNGSMARMGQSSVRMGNAIQQAGFQIGDFAVQVASGGGVLRPFIQQGTQLISMFGPWGAVIGAAGASIGALAVAMGGASDAADDLGEALSSLEAAGSEVDDLNAQIANSSGAVREALIRERDATLDLLKARLELARQSLAERRAAIEATAAQEVKRSREAAVQGNEVLEGIENVIPNDPRVVQKRVEQNIAAQPELAVELAALERQIAVTEAGLEKLSTLTTSPVDPLFSVGSGKSGGSSKSRSGRGGSSDKNVDAIRREIQAIHDRRDALERERSMIGLSEREQVQLTAAYEKQRIVEELLNKAREDGIALTPSQIEQANALAGEIESLAVANYDFKEALEAQADAAKEAQERQEELAKSVTDVANRMISAIQQADSFADALANIGLELAKLAIQGLGGQGPLGGLLGNVIGSLFGAGFSVGFGGGNLNPYGNPGSFTGGGSFPDLGFIQSAKGNAFNGGNIIPFARGGIVSGPTVFPMAGGMGLMGEAGPEAVMPLKRGAGGRLGVEGGSARVVIELSPGLEGRLLGQAHQNAVIEIRQSEARTLQKVPATAAAGFNQRPSLRR